MAHYDFGVDLAKSHASVQTVITLLQAHYSIEQIAINHTASHDFTGYYQGQPFTVEVKEDLLFSKTGNVAIEYKSRDKLSGLSTSTATYWCYKLGENAYLIQTNRLRHWLNQSRFKRVTGGDYDTSELILVPVDVFTSWCKKL